MLTPQQATELEPGDQWPERHRRPVNEALLGTPTPAEAEERALDQRILMR